MKHKEKWYKVSLSELREHTIHHEKVRLDFPSPRRSPLSGPRSCRLPSRWSRCEKRTYEYGFYCDECKKAIGNYIQVKGE